MLTPTDVREISMDEKDNIIKQQYMTQGEKIIWAAAWVHCWFNMESDVRRCDMEATRAVLGIRMGGEDEEEIAPHQDRMKGQMMEGNWWKEEPR